MTPRGRILIGLWLLLGVITGLRSEEVKVDLQGIASAGAKSFTQRGEGWTIAGRVDYDRNEQILNIAGTYRSDQPIEARAFLSYQVYDAKGDLLVQDGLRFPWKEASAEGVVADFILDLSFWDREPKLANFSIQFNAVVEGEYWYREHFPDIEFPRLEIERGPRRDSFSPKWFFSPRFLPAQTVVRLPVRWTVDYSDTGVRGYVGCLDVLQQGTDERVEATRMPWARRSGEHYGIWQWQLLQPVEAGRYQVRPGLVWDGVRWYDSEGWFEYAEIVFISPLLYLSGVLLLWALLVWGWARMGKLSNGWRRWLGLGLLVPLTIWGGLHVCISSSWIVVLASGGMAWAARHPWRQVGGRGYACTLIYVAFIEVFWGQTYAVSEVWKSATVFSIAVWALLLAPLLVIRSSRVRVGVVVIAMSGWLFITTGSVFYFRFFRDFPSIENLLYAGQVSDLGDSIISIGQQSFMIPILLGILFLGIVYWFKPREEAGGVDKV